MEKVTIEIETMSDAFKPEPEFMIARILHAVADKIEDGGEIDNLYDHNGNIVFKITFE